jgi:hypothetical protein
MARACLKIKGTSSSSKRFPVDRITASKISCSSNGKSSNLRAVLVLRFFICGEAILTDDASDPIANLSKTAVPTTIRRQRIVTILAERNLALSASRLI